MSAWTFRFNCLVRFDDPIMLALNDEKLRELDPEHTEAKYTLLIYPSMIGTTHKSNPIRVILRRNTDRTLVPREYAVTQTGAEGVMRNIPWPKEGILFQSGQKGIPTNACLSMVLSREYVGNDARLTTEPVGTANPSLLTILVASREGPQAFKNKIELRAANEFPSVCNVEYTIKDCSAEDIVEVYDPAMVPALQSAVLNAHAATGWYHMVKYSDRTGEVVNPYALDPLIPVASHSIIPNVNDASGIFVVDVFATDNPEGYPLISETAWIKMVENALWRCGLTVNSALTLLAENLDNKNYAPAFLRVVEAYHCLLSDTANCMPYRPDEGILRGRDGGPPTRAGTDDFRSGFAITQRSGDCEDLAKVIYEVSVQFSRLRTTVPILRAFQRLAACFVEFIGLFIVTSAKLEQTDAGEKTGTHTPYVPKKDGTYGLHAAVMSIPKPYFYTLLGRALLEPSDAEKINLSGYSPETEVPAVAAALPVSIIEGTGRMRFLLMNFRTYVEEQALALGTAEAMAEAKRLADYDESRLAITKKLFYRLVADFSEFGIKPEMCQYGKFHYDYDAIMEGRAMPASAFYVGGVELFSTTPAVSGDGFPHTRFAFVTNDPKTHTMLKSSLIESIVAKDERVALIPQPALTDVVYKCATMVMASGVEPSNYTDWPADDSGPDALLLAFEHAFDRSTPTVPEGHVYVDLFVPNKRCDARLLAKHVPGLKRKLLALKGVTQVQYRNTECTGGFYTGVLRLIVSQATFE
jgi:hypothetical protein